MNALNGTCSLRINPFEGRASFLSNSRTAVLYSMHETAASQWICRASARDAGNAKSYQSKKEQHIMAFGFPAYHTEHYSAGAGISTDLRGAVKSALTEISWSIREESSGQIIALTSISLLSWGEKVLINFLPDNSISVTSKCHLWQCVDWGKNQSNVQRFMAKIKKHA